MYSSVFFLINTSLINDRTILVAHNSGTGRRFGTKYLTRAFKLRKRCKKKSLYRLLFLKTVFCVCEIWRQIYITSELKVYLVTGSTPFNLLNGL